MELVHPVEANMVLRGSRPGTWPRPGPPAVFHEESAGSATDGTREVRLVASWSTSPDEVDAMVAAVSANM
ncbi:MAG: hypothetical protein R2716_08215 [Microthrixaceae bacterium]